MERDTMNTIAISRPADTLLRLVRVGMLPALAFAADLVLAQYSAKKECRGGDFSAEFSRDFKVRRCDLVVKTDGKQNFRIPLPR